MRAAPGGDLDEARPARGDALYPKVSRHAIDEFRCVDALLSPATFETLCESEMGPDRRYLGCFGVVMQWSTLVKCVGMVYS